MEVLSPVSCLLIPLGLVATALTSGFILVVVYLAYLHRLLAHIPSPKRASFFTGHIPSLRKRANQGVTLVDYLVDTMHECGPVFHLFFVHRPTVVGLDAAFHKEIFNTVAHLKPYSGYHYLMNVMGTRFLGSGLVTETDPVKHAKRRALFDPAFHRKYLMSLMDQFNASSDILVERLTKMADGKTEVAMLNEFNRLTLDVVTKVAFGLELSITEDAESPFTKALTEAMQAVQITFREPWKGAIVESVLIHDCVVWNSGRHGSGSVLLKWIVRQAEKTIGVKLSFDQMSPLPSDRRYKRQVAKAIKFLRETGRECVTRRLEAKRRGEKLPKDILTYILQVTHDLQGDDDFKMEEIVDEFVTFLIAGQETTANTLAFALVELGHHPEVMQRLKTEVLAVMGDNDYVEYSDLGKLDYMMTVIKETLRLWPPVFSTSRELGFDAEVRGYKIPAGTTVWLNFFLMGRVEKYFPNALEFDPDRFKATEQAQYAYSPFSMGHRSCIGKPFALIEARVIMAKLLKKFNFELVPGQGRGDILQELTLKPKGRCRNYITLAE